MEDGRNMASARREEGRADRAALFKALGDPTRLEILDAIAAEPDVCACGILERLHISQPTLSHHAKILCSAGLVECEKRGRWAHYRLRADRLDEAIGFLESLKR